MIDWFRTAFGQEYLTLYAHRNQEEAAQLARLILDETGVKQEEHLAPGPRVLDAPCGAGRHMRAFEQAGLRTYGFDLSEPLLLESRNHLPPHRIVRGDLRAIPYQPGTFDLVVNLFSSLGYFPDDKTNYDVLASLVELCKPSGWLVIDFMHSAYIHKNLQPESERTTPGGIHVHDRRWIEGTLPRVKKQTTLTMPDGSTKILNESVRLFTPEELRDQLSGFGLIIKSEFGDYSGAPFTSDSKRIIIAGQRQKVEAASGR